MANIILFDNIDVIDQVLIDSEGARRKALNFLHENGVLTAEEHFMELI